MSELERSGTRSRPLVRMERRTARQGREAGARLDALETSISKGVLLRDVALTTTPQDIEHGLGREFDGAWIVKGDVAAGLAVADSQNNKTWVRLSVSAAGTFNVWVF